MVNAVGLLLFALAEEGRLEAPGAAKTGLEVLVLQKARLELLM